MALEIVYLLTNPAMPGLVKIGMTTYEDVGSRLSALYSTGVPVPFELVFACRVPDAYTVEQALHRAFGPYRLNPKREFFQINVEQALAIMKLLHVEEITDDIGQKMDAETPVAERAAREALSRSRRPNMNFQEMGIAVGRLITCDDTAETATVLGPRKVLFRDQEVYLTEATRMVRQLPPNYAIQPSPYWSFDGVNLSELYESVYADGQGVQTSDAAE